LGLRHGKRDALAAIQRQVNRPVGVED